MKEAIMTIEESVTPFRTKEDCVTMLSNLFHAVYKNYEKGNISFRFLKNFIRALALSGQPQAAAMNNFKTRYGFKPPLFLLLSPTQMCNLSCPGCYANSDHKSNVILDYDIVHRILNEKRDSWGSYFTTISGGEPFMYHSKGKTIIDIFKEFPETLFLVYTNGTLITPELAEQLAELGNVTVAISVEGYQKETDARRGKNVHSKILAAMENLRKAGSMFGVSVTITSENIDLFLNNFDDFCHYYMDEQGAVFAWLFQYMPIGRNHDTMSLLVPPEKRKRLLEETWRLVREQGYFIADFWNSGTVSGGCIAGGRSDGFIYIDWNGNVMPCVFNPYYLDNIVDVYNKGGHLDDVLFSPLMEGIRKWQKDYYYNNIPAARKQNALSPCPLKDHFSTTYKLLQECNVKFSNPEAEAAFHDQGYYESMVKYGDETKEQMKDIWENYYLAPEKEKDQ
jgi:MoaA/NifB/PqqE/SkfB family radical SAM enzyme